MADENKVNEASSSQPQPGEDEEVIQLGDLLKHQEETEEEVAAVLGAGDEVNCSYDQVMLHKNYFRILCYTQQYSIDV